MKKVNITCRLDRDAVAFLDDLGARTDRDRSYLIKDAVSRYIKLHQWQIEEIEKGIAEANRGEFVTDKEVKAMFDELAR